MVNMEGDPGFKIMYRLASDSYLVSKWWVPKCPEEFLLPGKHLQESLKFAVSILPMKGLVLDQATRPPGWCQYCPPLQSHPVPRSLASLPSSLPCLSPAAMPLGPSGLPQLFLAGSHSCCSPLYVPTHTVAPYFR
jgi:hypothetical protein